MDAEFFLHPKLAADCSVLGDLPLSRLLLMEDARYPWCVLVPRRPELIELHTLSPEDAALLHEEIGMVAELLLKQPRVSKINVGALGNVVSQLHVHVVGRHEADFAWPGPVWGFGDPHPYEKHDREALVNTLIEQLPLSPPL